MEQKKNVSSKKQVQNQKKQPKKEKLYVNRKNLEDVMKEKKYSQKKLGDVLGVSDRAIGYYLSNRSPITEDDLYKIAEELQVSPEYILGKTNHPDKNLLTSLIKDNFDNVMSSNKYTFDFLRECGIDFEWNDAEQSLYMKPKDQETIFIDNNMYWFLVKQVKSFTKDLFMNYYHSPLALDFRLNHNRDIAKKKKEK